MASRKCASACESNVILRSEAIASAWEAAEKAITVDPTEPLARVMVEGPDADWIHARADELARQIAAEIGA